MYTLVDIYTRYIWLSFAILWLRDQRPAALRGSELAGPPSLCYSVPEQVQCTWVQCTWAGTLYLCTWAGTLYLCTWAGKVYLCTVHLSRYWAHCRGRPPSLCTLFAAQVRALHCCTATVCLQNSCNILSAQLSLTGALQLNNALGWNLHVCVCKPEATAKLHIFSDKITAQR